ncbi:MAG: helix-turn-helix domain-containing protein [Candidatus Aenigmarchaeota archaeon]|nr:helix-turn-helix domain-containing protein [Candidatus Aenigmarchaeota archaeon]
MEVIQYLTEREVAKITKRALPTLRNDRHLGKGIPFIKRGRSVRYSLADVIAWMEAGRVNTENGSFG